MKFGIIVFPGSNCDRDCLHVVRDVLHRDAELLWHKETNLKGSDCLILPGGFSYGDYLRSGAMAACSPIMNSVKEFADKGGIVFGICNGFQILQEARLLPGALIRNKSLKFICKDIHIRVERNDTPFTRTCKKGEVLRIPIAHMDGNFLAGEESLNKIERSGQVLFRYCDKNGDIGEKSNPNGSEFATAGIANERGNVIGMMPHPERCSESLLGNKDGIKIFESIVAHLENRR